MRVDGTLTSWNDECGFGRIESSQGGEASRVNGDKVVVFPHAKVRLKGTDEWVGGRFADGCVPRAGKFVEYRTFWEREVALNWADLRDETPT